MSRAPQPTSAELARCRKLAREAKKALEHPAASLGDLIAAAKDARRIPIPFGKLETANVFVRLVRLSQRYAEATAAQRRDLAAELGDVIAACERQLLGSAVEGAEPSASPRLPYRADIDG